MASTGLGDAFFCRRWLLAAGFLLFAPPASDFSIVFRFPADTAAPVSHGGLAPVALASGDGRLYATTCRGGTREAGSIFTIEATGRVRELHAFDNGACAIGGVLEDENGTLYGVAVSARESNLPFVYRIGPGGTLGRLYSFEDYRAGGTPTARLTLGSDDALYGIAGGPGNPGSIFRIDKAGNLTVLYAFPSNGTMGADPASPLVEAADGNFYGTTSAGGALHAGAVFRVTPEGEANVVHSFDPKTEGIRPSGGLVIGADGWLYGTTTGATHAAAGGTVYRVSLDGKFSVVHEFVGDDGAGPIGELVPATSKSALHGGYMYGVNRNGGAHGRGTVYRLNTSTGRINVLHTFGDDDDRLSPTAAVTAGPEAALYGTAESSDGAIRVVFRLSLDQS